MKLLRLLALVCGVAGAGEALALSVLPPTFSELVAKSDTIVRAEVVSRRCEWRESARGRKIVTLVKLRVESSLKGAAGAEIEYQQLGGQIGDERLEVSGLPEWAPGDRDYLFMAGNGRTLCPLIAVPHGRYPIAHDAQTGQDFVGRANGVPLESTEEVVLPMTGGPVTGLLSRLKTAPLSAPDFETAIRAEIARQAATQAAE